MYYWRQIRYSPGICKSKCSELRPVVITHFHTISTLAMVPTNRNENKWLTSRIPPLFCYCADHSQLSLGLTFINWCRLLYGTELFFVTFCILWPKNDLYCINPLNAELNPICHLLALLRVHHFLHVRRIRVKSLTLRLLMSYIYGAPILDVSRSHTTTHHSR